MLLRLVKGPHSRQKGIHLLVLKLGYTLESLGGLKKYLCPTPPSGILIDLVWGVALAGRIFKNSLGGSDVQPSLSSAISSCSELQG